MAMTAAAESAGADPDRASFTTALEAARDQVTAARGVADSADPADTGRIGRAVLDGLLPARRPRYSARKVKCSTSRYHVRDPEHGQDRPCQSVTITPGADHHPGPAPGPSRRAPPPHEPATPARSPPALPGQQKTPGHPHHGQPARPGLVRQRTRERACIKPRNLLTQLAEWTRLGFLSKTGRGRYALPGPDGPASTATDSAGPNPEIPTTLLTSRQHALTTRRLVATPRRSAGPCSRRWPRRRCWRRG